MSKMNPEVKAKWVAALRSGEYEQTTGILCNGEGGFCCLGVATDLYMKETGVGKWSDRVEFGEVMGVIFESKDEREEAVLPIEVSTWMGLNCDVPEVSVPAGIGRGYTKRGVADLNDGGRTFLEIADLIEAQL